MTDRKMTPSGLRNKLEVRVRRLSGRVSIERRREALQEIRDMAQEALDDLDKDHPRTP